MKKKKRIVYYCDFCKKRLMRINAMVQHEKHCTANLDRKCRICENNNVLPDYREILKKLKTRYIICESQTDTGLMHNLIGTSIKWINKEITRDTLANLTDGCPACMLTLWRAIDDIAKPQDFNYKKELEIWWNEINALKREEMDYNAYTI